MRGEPRRLRPLIGWCAALCAAILLATVVPGTSSAFTAIITNSKDTAASKAVFTCADVFAGDARRTSAFFEYALREDGGATTAVDSSAAGHAGTYQGANDKDTASPRPCPADAGAPYALDGSSSRIITSALLPPIRQDFSIEIWFKTTGVSEKLIGFEGTRGDASDNYDKHLYVDDAGHLQYGIYDGNTRTIVSSRVLNDGAWHQAVATTSATDGSKLYIDGVLDGTDSAKTLAEGFSGYWRIGQGKTQQWPGAPSTSYFTGSLSFAAAYGEVLSASEIRAAYDIGKPGPVAPTPTPTPTPSSTATPGQTATPAPGATPAPTATVANPHPAETAILVTPSQDASTSSTQ